jgi:hypothetical protein
VTYRIARNGKIYGPYSTAEVVRHMAGGYILAGDLAQGEEQEEWLPVEELFPASPVSVTHPGGMPALYEDPPDLLWWIALLLGVLTLGAFFVVWDLVESAWMRRVSRTSLAIWVYVAATVLFVLNLPSTWNSVAHVVMGVPLVESAYSGMLGWAALAVRLIARFVFRSELLEHFNGPEPIGLKLNWFWTLLFGGLYFQYHFNCVNGMKRTLRISVPAG